MRKFDIFILIVSFIGLLLSKSFMVFFVFLGLLCFLLLLRYLASKNPHAYWVKLFFGSRDTKRK